MKQYRELFINKGLLWLSTNINAFRTIFWLIKKREKIHPIRYKISFVFNLITVHIINKISGIKVPFLHPFLSYNMTVFMKKVIFVLKDKF